MAGTAIRLIVPSGDRRHVLARPNGLAGWQLPRVSVSFPPALTGDDVASCTALLRAPVAPVRQVAVDAWEVEATARVPSLGHDWIAVEDSQRLGADRTLVDEWHEDDPPDPLLRPGHLDRLARWTSDVLGIDELPEPRWLRHWALGSVVAFGDVVAKQVGRPVGPEGVVLAALQGTHPAVPTLRASDERRTLTALVTGVVAGTDDWPAVVETMGAVQAAAGATAPSGGELLLDRLDERATTALARLDAAVPERAIVHPDLHPGNVVIGDDGPVLLDWTDAGWGQPLLALRVAMEHLDPETTLRAWARGRGVDPDPVLPLGDAVLVAGSAMQERGYRIVAPYLPAPVRPQWDEWHGFWLERLERDLTAAHRGDRPRR